MGHDGHRMDYRLVASRYVLDMGQRSRRDIERYRCRAHSGMGGRRSTRDKAYLCGLGALVALAVFGSVAGLWNLTAGFGTRGEKKPANTVDTWMADLFPGFGSPNRVDAQRLTCSGIGGKQSMSIFNQYATWQNSYPDQHFSVAWFDDRVTTHGDTATVTGHADTNIIAGPGQFYGSEPTPWKFKVINYAGWRICGITITTPPAESYSPTPEVEPPTANPIPPAPPQPCASDDPYRDLRSCPPTR